MADVAAQLQAAASALAADGPKPGRAWCRAWTTAMDAALQALDRDRGQDRRRGRLAVVALGGYGRRELCPGSDVDLLLLAEGQPDEALEALVRALVYPLWDAGLTVGYAIRDGKQAVSAALGDVSIATSTLDGRLVVGAEELWRSVRVRLIDELGRRRDRFLSALEAADAARRARYGDTAEVLEPNLKDGAGGIRDIQSLRWAAATLLGEAELDPLVATRYLTALDRARLARAYDQLLAVRVALHLEAGRGDDVLTLARQDAVAKRLGYRGGEPADALLGEVFLAARTVDHVHRNAWTLITSDVRRGGFRRLRRPAQQVLAGGFTIADGVVRIDDATDVTHPAFPTVLLEALTTTDATLDRSSAARIVRQVEADEPTWGWDDDSRDRFLTVLWRGRPALRALAELDHLGLLEALIPEWGPLRARPQRNPFHRYSLDRHAFHTAAALSELVRSEPWAEAALRAVDDPDALMLAALLHDVGKAHGEPHTESGPPVARAVAARLQAPPATCDLVARLTRLHLLLPEVATRRDLADRALIREVAASVGDRGTLAALHLLAAADGIATGPSAWTSWKASLVAALAAEVAAVLEHAHPDDLHLAEASAEEALQLAPEAGADPAAVRAHLSMLPARYVASVTAAAVVRHACAAADPLGPTEVRAQVIPGDHGVDVLEVVAADHLGLFAQVAGVLALHGGSVLKAHAFTRSDRVAVDSFWVRRPEGADEPWWKRVSVDLGAAVAGRLALRARLARKVATGRFERRAVPPIPARVEVAPDRSGETSVVEVHARDDVGVLYRITATLAELGADIVAAKVDTVGHEVIDVFYVRDRSGRPLTDDHAGELELAIRSALDA